MHRLIIHKLGPIDHCELECSQFMTLTGCQASGKSTVAKVIYYFRTIKEDILENAESQAFDAFSKLNGKMTADPSRQNTLRKSVINHLRSKFMRTFGSSWGMENEMYIEYLYTRDCTIVIYLKEDDQYNAPNYIWIKFSKMLLDFLRDNEHRLSATSLGISEEEKQRFKSELNVLFDDPYSVVYIPAGRSMMTSLSQQLSYLYAVMGDEQKRSIDSCTKDYIERILRLKPEFSEGLRGLIHYSGEKVSPSKLKQALYLIDKILCGTYQYSNGEEQIILGNEKYVKINFASSGQQESVWILNLLFYYLLKKNPTLFIIEEPESHLFPESQKYITELIALVNNSGNAVLLTTHSPYVLGTLNNLLYANTLCRKYNEKINEKINEIICHYYWLDYQKFDSWFLKDGMVETCMDRDIHMIQNEKIDEISNVINHDFDELMLLQEIDVQG